MSFNRSFIKINGIQMPSPSAFSVTITDISGDNSQRDSRGTMHIDRITTKRKIELEWKFLNMKDMSTVLNLVKDIFFEVEYPDPMVGNMVKKIFYVGDRNVPMYSCINKIPCWQNIKYNLIEQ